MLLMLGHLIVDGFLATKNCFITVPEMRFKKLRRNMAASRGLDSTYPRPGLGQASVSFGALRMPTNLLHHDPQNRTQKSGKNIAAIKRPRLYEQQLGTRREKNIC